MDILWFVPVIVITLGLIAWKLKKEPKLTKNQFYKSREQISRTEKLDPNHALMDAHKAFIGALQTLYPKDRTNAASLVKRVVKRLPNEKVIWKLHRTRNLAAHQTNFDVYDRTASQARHEFIRALKALS